MCSLEQPLYEVSGASVQSNTLPPDVTLEQGSGLACLPAGIDHNRLTLSNKLRVLNCLVFSTPHYFWVKGSGTRDAEQLKSAIDSSTGRFAWLDRGDWSCTKSPEGPVPSCLKHDVAYGGLQKIAGMNTDAPNDTELDEAWNPRNKALADYKFKADIERWGCQDQTGLLSDVLCRIATSGWMADEIYFRGTAKVNHKGWPVTTRDVEDIDAHAGFITCNEPVVPRVANVGNVTRQGNMLTTVWDWEPGCVAAGLGDVSFYVEWDIPTHPFRILNIVDSNSGVCTVSGNTLTCQYGFSDFAGTVTGVAIYVVPRDREYGGRGYGGDGRTGRRYANSVGPFEFNLN